jgi:hypothetical protein
MPTIMSKTSQQVKDLNKVLGNLVSLVTLNHAKPKDDYRRYNYSGSGTKGVKSDHIKIFQFQDQKKSFAFSYHFNSVDHPVVVVSIKDGDNINSAKYSEATFRQKLNQFVPLVQTLKDAEALTHTSLEKIVYSHFIKNSDVNSKNTLATRVNLIKESLKKEKNKSSKLLNEVEVLKLEIESIEAKVKHGVSMKRKSLKIEEMRKSLELACVELEEYATQLKKTLNSDATKTKLVKNEAKLNSFASHINEAINKQSLGLTKQELQLLKTQITAWTKIP